MDRCHGLELELELEEVGRSGVNLSVRLVHMVMFVFLPSLVWGLFLVMVFWFEPLNLLFLATLIYEHVRSALFEQADSYIFGVRDRHSFIVPPPRWCVCPKPSPTRS